MIYGERIRQAREYCGLTQTELAKRVGVNQSAIAHLESRKNIPTDDLLKLIAANTDFMPSFFEKEPAGNIPFGTLVFRARNSLTARELSQAYQHANVLFEHVQKMSEQFKVPSVRIPASSESPAKAATLTRVAFSLSPDTPIKKLIFTIEKNGVVVLALPIVLRKIDAFSTWVEASAERPVIAISSGKPTDRIRFSIAHELGHLVMHRVVRGRIAQIEKDADKFAAEFLLPEKAMRQEILAPVTLTSIARMKLRWGVSMQALIHRARDLDIITERQYRYLFEQLSTRGWRTNEPPNLDGPEEKPRLVAKMIDQLYRDSNVIESLAKDLGISKKRVIDLLDEHIERERVPLTDYRVTPEQLEKFSHN